MLNGKQFEQASPIFSQALQWLEHFPTQVDARRRQVLLQAISKSFTITEQEIYAKITRTVVAPIDATNSNELVIRKLLPKNSFLEWYADYTFGTESPLAFHVFAALVVLGASLGRRVFKDKGGFFRIYPNMCAILLGPTGKVMKTSAVDIAMSFVKEAVLCPIMADAITPESIVDALVSSGHHFVYAPEFAIFFGKQRYNEGLTTLMLRLLDCPSEYTRKTVTRGEITITNVALSVLGGSTMSLLSTSTPDQVTSSGFLNRFVLVIENSTTRSFPEPVRGDPVLRMKMMQTLDRLKSFSGEVTFNKETADYFDIWYNARKKLLRELDDEVAAETIQRGPVHLERMAMLIHLSHCDTFNVCINCFKIAEGLLNYVETNIPQITGILSKTAISREADFVVAALERLGGIADRSTLMRRVSSKLGKTDLDRHLATLKEMHTIREDKRGLATIYILEGTQNGTT